MSIDAQGNIHDRSGRYSEKGNSAPSGGLSAGDGTGLVGVGLDAAREVMAQIAGDASSRQYLAQVERNFTEAIALDEGLVRSALSDVNTPAQFADHPDIAQILDSSLVDAALDPDAGGDPWHTTSQRVSMLEALRQDPRVYRSVGADIAQRFAVALREDPELSAATRNDLSFADQLRLSHGSKPVRYVLSHNPNLDPNAYRAATFDIPYIQSQREIALTTDRPAVMERVAHSRDVWARERLAQNPALSGEARQLVLTDPSSTVQERLAGRVDLTEDEIAVLDQSESVRVRTALAINPVVPRDLTAKIRSASDVQERIRGNAE